MEGELEEARTCYLEDDDTQDLDKNGLLSESARRSLLEKNAPKRCGNLSSNWPFQSVRMDLLSVEEYIALQTLAIARNYDGIAHAQAEKPKRQIDRDALIPEQPLYVEGADGTSYGGEGQIENLGDDRTATLRQNVHLAHRFEEADLKDILAYDTAERRQAFVKELEEIAFMHDGELPPPTDRKKVEIRREDLSDRLLTPFQGLAHLDDLLTDVIARQRTTFGAESSKACPANNPEGDTDVPPEPGELVAKPDEQDAKARFAPSDCWRRPSDYVAYMAKRFETDWTNPHSGKKESRPLKRDQGLFVAQFAHICNTVWDEDRKVEEGEMNANKITCFDILLMGQGGSGKTAVVQDIVLPTLDFLFGCEATLIVCAKWSQAENISTDAHKAITCHRAASVGIQSYRNANILPGDKKEALRRRWENKRCLVLEEVSMIGPDLYNLLLYRSFHGRRARWNVLESEYDKLQGAFGRMPILIHLGDFLQKKPIGGHSISLIDDLKERERSGKLPENFPPEYQMAMKLFCQAPLCFEFQASNRIKEPKLRALMNFIRDPPRKIPDEIKRHWEAIKLKEDDTRLREERFQIGHMIGIYWATVSRWMMMRAKRDAAALRTPLFLVQAADVSKPTMPLAAAKKLMNVANPKDSGGMHGMLALHVGMRIRLLDALDESKTLVKDAEGVVVRIEPHADDQQKMEDALRMGAGMVYLEKLPKGVWARMDKYAGAPFTKLLQDNDSTLLSADTRNLVFIERRTADPFVFREYTVSRTGLPISHARVITSTACQGRTMRDGVIIDCGRQEGGSYKKEDDDWWLDLYVMLSRATKLEDLLLLRAPDLDFFAKGPPKTLRKQLAKFARRTEDCRKRAEQIARELGLAALLRQE